MCADNDINTPLFVIRIHVHLANMNSVDDAGCTFVYYTWFVPKVSVLIFLCTNWQRNTSLMYIGTLVVTLAACPYLFQLDWLSQ